MPCSSDILISVKPEYCKKILSGDKTVELRRRPVRVSVGTTVWIYETVPRCRVGARAQVSEICEDTPTEIWRRFGDQVGISREQFASYFEGADYACAVVLSEVVPLRTPLQLADLRESLGAFVAPQFYRKLQMNGPELTLFRTFAPGMR